MTSRIATSASLASLTPAIVAGQPATGSRQRAAVARSGDPDRDREQPAAADRTPAGREGGSGRGRARTRRLPVFETEVTASQLLTPVEFAFPQGRLRRVPGHRPDSGRRHHGQRATSADHVRVVAGLAADLAAVSHRPRHRSAVATRDIEREQRASQQLSVINSVKRLYFAILQTESALDGQRGSHRALSRARSNAAGPRRAEGRASVRLRSTCSSAWRRRNSLGRHDRTRWRRRRSS